MKKNKKTFISLLHTKLYKNNYLTKIADEDADRLIITTAVELQEDDKIVKIFGEDTDLMVLLTQLAPSNKNIYCKPGKGKEIDKVYNCDSFKYPNLKRFVGLLYIISGCDTTSCFLNKAKIKY